MEDSDSSTAQHRRQRQNQRTDDRGSSSNNKETKQLIRRRPCACLQQRHSADSIGAFVTKSLPCAVLCRAVLCCALLALAAPNQLRPCGSEEYPCIRAR